MNIPLKNCVNSSTYREDYFSELVGSTYCNNRSTIPINFYQCSHLLNDTKKFSERYYVTEFLGKNIKLSKTLCGLISMIDNTTEHLKPEYYIESNKTFDNSEKKISIGKAYHEFLDINNHQDYLISEYTNIYTSCNNKFNMSCYDCFKEYKGIILIDAQMLKDCHKDTLISCNNVNELLISISEIPDECALLLPCKQCDMWEKIPECINIQTDSTFNATGLGINLTLSTIDMIILYILINKKNTKLMRNIIRGYSGLLCIYNIYL